MSHDSVMWFSLSPPPLNPVALQISLEGFADLLIQSLVTLEKKSPTFCSASMLSEDRGKGLNCWLAAILYAIFFAIN